jgi:hypothetical protein
MTVGFALGPLVSSLLAIVGAVASDHALPAAIALTVIVLIMLRSAPETVAAGQRSAINLSPRGARHPRFRKVVGPMAPWVFAAPAVAFALLPSVVGAEKLWTGSC